MVKRGHIKDLIVQFLSVNKNQIAANIHLSITARYVNCTIQALYAELRKLETAGVIVKGKRFYNLSLPWIIDRLNFAEKMYQTYSIFPFPTGVLPEKGKKCIWKFTNINRLDDFSLQIILTLLHTSTDKQFIAWARHPWFLLAHKDKELRFEKNLKNLKIKQILFIEGNTKLDRELVQKYDKNIITREIGVLFPGWRRFGSFIAIIGEYLVYQDIRGKTDSDIDKIFLMSEQVVTGQYESQHYKNLMGIFNNTVSARIVVESMTGNYFKVKKIFNNLLN